MTQKDFVRQLNARRRHSQNNLMGDAGERFSLKQTLGRFSLLVAMSACCRLFVPSVGNRNQESWRSLVKECIAKFDQLRFPFLEGVYFFFFLGGGGVQLAGGGSLAVTVGVGDR